MHPGGWSTAVRGGGNNSRPRQRELSRILNDGDPVPERGTQIRPLHGHWRRRVIRLQSAVPNYQLHAISCFWSPGDCIQCLSPGITDVALENFCYSLAMLRQTPARWSQGVKLSEASHRGLNQCCPRRVINPSLSKSQLLKHHPRTRIRLSHSVIGAKRLFALTS